MRQSVLIAAVLVVLDQVTKVLVKTSMMLGESHPMIGSIVNLTFVENPGMAFGISWGDGKLILTLLTIVIAGVLVWYLRQIANGHWAPRLAVTLILAGAVGNLIDRALYGVIFGDAPLFYGRVVDFIQVDIPDITWLGDVHTHFPVFNIADSCVTVGVLLLLLTGNKLPATPHERADA
ncbi:MAG: Signal peptidase [Bacteroidota bacterium]|jgi:signal peptidase II